MAETKPQGVLIKQWEMEYAMLISNQNIRIQMETVKTTIRSAFEDGMFEQWRITLKCPLSGQRIKVPARYADCVHIECFDLEAFLRMKMQKNLLACPICQNEIEKPLANIRIDEYIETVLSTLPDAMKVELLPDGSFTKVHEELVMVPIVIQDDEPYVRDINVPFFDVKQEAFENDDEHITLSDGEDQSTGEIVEIKPIFLLPLNMDTKPKIALSSEPEQIHFREGPKIQDQRTSTTHKACQSRKKRVRFVFGSSVEDPKKRKEPLKEKPSAGPSGEVDTHSNQNSSEVTNQSSDASGDEHDKGLTSKNGDTRKNAQILSRCFRLLFSNKTGDVPHFADIISETSDGNGSSSDEARSNPDEEIGVNTLPVATDQPPILRKGAVDPEKTNPEANVQPKTGVQRENLCRDVTEEDTNEKENENLKTSQNIALESARLEVEEIYNAPGIVETSPETVPETNGHPIPSSDYQPILSPVVNQQSEISKESMEDDGVAPNDDLSHLTRARDIRKSNRCKSNESKVQSNSKLKVRPQLNKKRQIDIGKKRAFVGEKCHKCKQCHYGTNRKDHLTKHIRRHNKVRSHKCQICNFASTERYDLIRHERTHSGEKPFKCSPCQFASARSCHLIRHMRTQRHKGILKLHTSNSKKNAKRNMLKSSKND